MSELIDMTGQKFGRLTEDTQILSALIKDNKINNKKLYTIICKYDWLVKEILNAHK